MRITFENMPSARAEERTTSYRTAHAGTERAARGYTLDISDQVTDGSAYSFRKGSSLSGSRRTAEDIMQAAAGQDIAQYRNYMTVMSNSMSDQDFAKLQKEGYHPADMDLTDAVTILDTIKAELIKAGVEITGYTDTLDRDTLIRITGNEAYAGQLTEAFAREDLPLTQKNAEQALSAFRRAKELTELGDGTTKYLVTNECSPTIDTLYLAQHVGAADADRQAQGYFGEELPGYYARKATNMDMDSLWEQIDHILEEAGYLPTEENKKEAEWLIEKGIPFTEESFALLKEIKAIKLPAEDVELFSAIAAAMAEGHPAGEANPAEGKSIYRRAADCLKDYENRYQELQKQPDTPETVKARRQLEEIRLHMTVEANLKLLRSGFAVDTAPMEDTIAALKQWETSRVQEAFPDRNPIELCQEALQKTAEFDHLPVAALGRLLSMGQPLTVDNIYETGSTMREVLRQAGEAYETMQTAPRADLGDSIRTAFRNVDALLQNMGQELTEENRRAVRSLSYNRMELTEENLLAVKGADKVVQRVVEKMTPSSVLSMIRDGVNPLDTSMEELEQYLLDQDTYQEDSEKYSRFLYTLEKNHEITQEEKTSFIGIYRMLHQLEKTDGAAVGKLVGAQAEITFANLLSAIRTGKMKGVDISVSDACGSLQEAVSEGASIDAQIDAAYDAQQLSRLRMLHTLDEVPVKLLQRLEQPVTAENLFAADQIRKDGGIAFKRLHRQGDAAFEKLLSAGGLEDPDQLEEVFATRESAGTAYEQLIERSRMLAKELTFAEGTGSVDVKLLQAAYRQLGIQGVRGQRDEEYDIPQMIEGELTSIHLKLVHGSQDSGRVTVGMDTVRYGYLSGEFSMEGAAVSGFFAGAEENAQEVLKKAAGCFEKRLENGGLKAGSIQIIRGSLAEKQMPPGEEKAETKQLYRMAGMILAAWKESL